MSEEAKIEGKPKPEIRGKVIAVLPEWRNNTGTFWKRDVVVETGWQFPNPLKVSFQKDKANLLADVGEGEWVAIPYALNGRRWDGPNGAQYFVDIVGLGLHKLAAGATGRQPGATAPAAPAAAKPVLGCSAKTAIDEWVSRHGHDNAATDFAKFCQALKPGKASKTYTAADWADVVNAIRRGKDEQAADGGIGATVDDDLPF